MTKAGDSLLLRTVNGYLFLEYAIPLPDGENSKFIWYFLEFLQYEDFPAYVLIEV